MSFLILYISCISQAQTTEGSTKGLIQGHQTARAALDHRGAQDHTAWNHSTGPVAVLLLVSAHNLQFSRLLTHFDLPSNF